MAPGLRRTRWRPRRRRRRGRRRRRRRRPQEPGEGESASKDAAREPPPVEAAARGRMTAEAEDGGEARRRSPVRECGFGRTTVKRYFQNILHTSHNLTLFVGYISGSLGDPAHKNLNSVFLSGQESDVDVGYNVRWRRRRRRRSHRCACAGSAGARPGAGPPAVQGPGRPGRRLRRPQYDPTKKVSFYLRRGGKAVSSGW